MRLASLALLTLTLCGGTAVAELSPQDLGAYLAGSPQVSETTPAINPIVELLTTIGRHHGVRAASEGLMVRWRVDRATADALLAVVVLDGDRYSTERRPAGSIRRQRTAFEYLVALDSDSPTVWGTILWQLEERHRCDSPAIRRQYFAHAWAVDALLRSDSFDCSEWLYEVPRVAAPSGLLYARLSDSTGEAIDGIAPARAFRDSVVRDGRPYFDPLRVYANRLYFTRLATQGLSRDLVAELDALPADEQETILDGEGTGPEVIDGRELEPSHYTDMIATDVQADWLFALLDTGHADAARQWLARWQWPPAERVQGDRKGGDDSRFGSGEADTREALRQLLDDTTENRIFELFVGDGERGFLFSSILSNPVRTRVAAGYLERHGYPEVAAYMTRDRCARHDFEPKRSWSAFPPEFQALQASYAEKVRSDGAALQKCPDRSAARAAEAAARARIEIPLPTELRSIHAKDAMPVLPPRVRQALKDFQVVRYDARGGMCAAISLSQDVDPVGEVSGGGYWLHLSADHCQTWREPLYLGLQQYEPYTVVAESKLPLLHGRTLQIEVEVREVDPDSIFFPPVALHAVRRASNLFIELSLDDIERDSDGDGLTDLLEEKLRTNPHDPDTDHDGLRDDVDPLPQASVTAPPAPNTELLSATLKAIFGFEAAAIGTGGPRDASEPAATVLGMLAEMKLAAKKPTSQRTLFIQGDKHWFTGIIPAEGRVVVVSGDEARELRAKCGVFYPVEIDLFVSHDGDRAVVVWSASWTGGTLSFTKSGGHWSAPERSGWITWLRTGALSRAA